jgi:uncharacterized lipoprotein YddW (UPF0748 family)
MSVLVILLAALWGGAAWATPPASIQGVWLSPDWILPGTRTYTESEARQIIHNTVEALKQQGINTVFMETLVRGSSIAVGGDVPIYPHLKWSFAHRGTRTVDVLQLLIDEADGAGIAVHAWMHMFYWRMDNDDVYRPWQRAASIWDPLLVIWMGRQAGYLKEHYKRPDLQSVLAEMMASIRAGGVDGRELSAILRRHRIDPEGRPLGVLIHALMAEGCPAPDFLLIGSADDPFPRTPGRSLRPIYINGENAEVRKIVSGAVVAISDAHPDLAGIHLDHIRFPTDGQGIPAAWQPRGRDALYFNMSIPVMAVQYRKYAEMIKARRDALSSLVNEIAAHIHRGQYLSAAVLPLYYVERSDGTDRFNGYDYSGQDWHTWNVDFVVPMMYGFDPWRIRTLCRRFSEEVQAEATPDRPAPLVVPGVSKLSMAQSGVLGKDEYVFFDLTLGLDLHYEREHDEDYNWQPRKDL